MRIVGLLRGAGVVGVMLVALGGCYISLGGGAPEDEQEVLTLSLGDGGLVRRGDLVQIEVTLPETEAGASADGGYQLTILLQDADGREIIQRALPYAEGDPLPPLTLDDLGLTTNRYRLTVRVLDGDKLVSEKVVEFTFVGEEYALREITSDAPIVHPGSTVSLTVDLAAPPGSNPVLVWSAMGKTFAQGSLSEGLGTVEWTAPSAPGIYTVTVSLYPLGSTTTAEDLGTAVYVAPIESPTGELAPESSYLALYHLLGNLTDAGQAGQDATALPARPLKLLTRGNIVGYRLDGESGFTVSRVLVPATDDGSVGPFSVTIGFTPGETPASGTLFDARSEDGAFRLRLGLTADGVVYAEMNVAELTQRVQATAPLPPEERSEIALSLYPDPESEGPDAPWTAVLFLDGSTAAIETWARGPHSGAAGRTTVGGPGGASGLVDEVGVYVRDGQGRPAPDPGLFTRAFQLDRGANAAGDGFDGMYLGPGYIVTGEVRLSGGLLELPPDASVTTPPYTIDPAGSSLRVTLTAALTQDGLARLVWDGAADTEAPIVSIAGGGETERIELTLTPERDILRVVQASPAAETTVSLSAGKAIRVVLSNQGDAQHPLEVDDIAVWPTR